MTRCAIDKIIYLDNAATVFPKPESVLHGAIELYNRYGVNPGRSGYDLCMIGADLVQETRNRMATFFGGTDPDRLSFCANASDALNILIQGLAVDGGHVVSTVLEHNSVLRPLNHLAAEGRISVDYITTGEGGTIDPAAIAGAFKDNTNMVVMSHASNVIGTIQPIAETGKLCRERGIHLVVDVAQTAGVIPIDVEAMNIDALAFTGHKSLMALSGIGGLYTREGVEVKQTRFGGTGVRSADPLHPEKYPFRLEVGTQNLLGIFGLHESQTYLAEQGGIDRVFAHELELFTKLQAGLMPIDGVTLHGTTSLKNRLPVLSLTIMGWDPADVGMMLDVDHNIATRTGLHCAPLIHKMMGTQRRGTVRMSIGPGNTEADIDAAIKAIEHIAAEAPGAAG
jgi:cysteine desulfurase/selenocysteine lyase